MFNNVFICCLSLIISFYIKIRLLYAYIELACNSRSAHFDGTLVNSNLTMVMVDIIHEFFYVCDGFLVIINLLGTSLSCNWPFFLCIY